MKRIQTFNVKLLRVEEDFGFHKLILSEIGNLPGAGEDAPPHAATAAFATAVAAFDDALKASGVRPATAVAAAADDARDAAWRGSNNYVKAMRVHPSADVVAAAGEAKGLFDKYGDPTSLAQTEKSGVLHNLLQDLDALDSGKRALLALDPWIADLREKETAFLAAAARRVEEAAARQVGVVRETRLAADAAYRSLADTVNALALVGGADRYAAFIDRVNALIDRQKTVLRARKTKSEKEEEAD